MVSEDSFDVRMVKVNGRAIVFASGEIDTSTGPAFRQALLAAQQGAPNVTVDLREVAFMDSTGVNALMGAYQRAPQGHSLRVVSPSPAVRRVLDITGVSEVLLLESYLTWRQVTYHNSGWRQWMTVETTNDGLPVAEIIEVGSPGDRTSENLNYALETNGDTSLHQSLGEAMTAAEHLGFVAPQTSEGY
jgi:anti-anti-sigma factor